jgi:hypothetical protein
MPKELEDRALANLKLLEKKHNTTIINQSINRIQFIREQWAYTRQYYPDLANSLLQQLAPLN